MIGARKASLALLLLPPLVLSACAAPPAANHYGSGSKQSAAAQNLTVRPVNWNGIFSCTAHIEGKLPAITWKRIPFRQEGDSLTGLYIFTDSFKHRDSVLFSGTLTGESARVSVTAVRANGSSNFTAEMSGSPASMTGQMLSGMSPRPVRSCTLALAAS